MARLNITVVVPVSPTQPLDDNPTDAFLMPWKTHLQSADREVDDAEWGVSEQRRLQGPGQPRYFHDDEDKPDSYDGITREED